MSWQSEWCLGVLALIDSGLIRIVVCYLHFFTIFQVWTIMILKKLTNKNIHDYHLSCCCCWFLFVFVCFLLQKTGPICNQYKYILFAKHWNHLHNNKKRKNRTKRVGFWKLTLTWHTCMTLIWQYITRHHIFIQLKSAYSTIP